MKKTKILLADDHRLVRAGIKSLLNDLPDVEIIGEASNGREVIDMIDGTRPDILLLDIAMPELNGIEVARRINKDFPDIKIIMLSMHSNEEYVYQALSEGVKGYLLKDSIPSELEVAINSVLNDNTYLSPVISKNLVNDLLKQAKKKKKSSKEIEVFSLLTERQREILQLIAEGNSTKEIAEKLHISIKTVESHRTQMMKKLDIHDIAGLVRYAIRIGIISSEK